MEAITGWTSTERIIHKNDWLADRQKVLLHQYTAELLAKRPVQYVLQEAWFAGMKFFVDERVLIPRPETEELVAWIIDDHLNHQNLKIADIGTGSGCIAVAIKKKLPFAQVIACDKSEAALQVARLNAESNQTSLSLMALDILDSSQRNQIAGMDILVSNPPYIPLREKSEMAEHVTRYEPAEALFVPDNDPLIFYRELALFGKHSLLPGGTVYVELHTNHAKDVEALYRAMNFETVELKKDLQGKWRLLKATMLL